MQIYYTVSCINNLIFTDLYNCCLSLSLNFSLHAIYIPYF